MGVVGWQLGMFLGVSKSGESGESGRFRPNNYLFSNRSKFNRYLLLSTTINPTPRSFDKTRRGIPILKHLVMEHKGRSLYQEEAEGVGLHGMVILLSSIVNMVSPPPGK